MAHCFSVSVFQVFNRGCELFQSWFLVEKELESLPGDEEGRIARNIFHTSDTILFESHPCNAAELRQIANDDVLDKSALYSASS